MAIPSPVSAELKRWRIICDCLMFLNGRKGMMNAYIPTTVLPKTPSRSPDLSHVLHESGPTPIGRVSPMLYKCSPVAQMPAKASDSIKHISSEPICAIHARGAMSPATSAMSPAFLNPNMNCEPHVFPRPLSFNASVNVLR